MKRIGIVGALALLLCIGAAHAAGPPMRIFIAGDSTAAVYGPERYPQLGWGMVLKCAFDPDEVQVIDMARAGRSTKSFRALGHWSELIAQVRAGDTVLIQFGHNDERTDDLARYTDPDTDFRANLRAYVAEVRARGGQPVLLTPITRRTFVDGKVVDTHGPYGRAILAVARETNTPVADINADSMAWLQGVGEAASKRYFLYVSPSDRIPYYPAAVEDDQHTNELGARALANVVAAGLVRLNLPISARVRAERPALTRTVPTGGAACE